MFLHSCKLTPFTAGASSIYDGTPLVEQSVARVRTPHHTHKFSTLSDVSPNDREPPSSTCPSITALDLSVSLKDPKLWNVLPSTSACATNGPRLSGCKLTSHRLVEIPARYVPRPSSSAITEITNHDRSLSVERAQEQCLPRITTLTIIFPLLLGLLYAVFSPHRRGA